VKVTALEEHECYCCGEKISRGEECFVFVVDSADPEKSEFDVIRVCSKCFLKKKLVKYVRAR